MRGVPASQRTITTDVAAQFRLELPDTTELRGVLSAVLASLRSRHQIDVAIGPGDLEPLPRGLLVVGIQGCGKSLAAKAGGPSTWRRQ